MDGVWPLSANSAGTPGVAPPEYGACAGDIEVTEGAGGGVVESDARREFKTEGPHQTFAGGNRHGPLREYEARAIGAGEIELHVRLGRQGATAFVVVDKNESGVPFTAHRPAQRGGGFVVGGACGGEGGGPAGQLRTEGVHKQVEAA